MRVKKRTDLEFIRVNPDFERYVRVHSRAFVEIFGQRVKDASENGNELEGLVQISCAGKTVYRKCIGANIDSELIEIGYRTICELSIDYGENVDVRPASWFEYYWNNSESGIKHPFRIAVVGFIITVLSFISDIVSFFVSFCTQL